MSGAASPALALQQGEYPIDFRFHPGNISKAQSGLDAHTAQNFEFVLVFLKVQIIGHPGTLLPGVDKVVAQFRHIVQHMADASVRMQAHQRVTLFVSGNHSFVLGKNHLPEH